MLENHHLQQTLPNGNSSIAYFAREPTGRLLIFVHGFGGHATQTWHRMHELAVLDPATRGCDIIFYGYDSLRHRAMIHAATFRDFLEELTDGKAAWLPAEREGHQAYDRIVISAHSLGAAVARQALLMGHRAKSGWAKVARIVCFAPAHRGASGQLGALVGGGGLRGLIYALVLVRAPVLDDLRPDPELSPFLSDLRSGHKNEMPDPPGPPLLAHKVVFGDEDRIVQPNEFYPGEPYVRWKGHDHISLCKADEAFRDPLQIVLEALA